MLLYLLPEGSILNKFCAVSKWSLMIRFALKRHRKLAASYKKGKGHPMILSPFAVLSCQPHYSWPMIAYGSTLSTVNRHQAASFIPLENHQEVEVLLNLL